MPSKQITELDALFIKALKSLRVTVTPVYMDPKSLELKRGLLYRPENGDTPYRIPTDILTEKVVEASALEGFNGVVKAYGEIFGKVIAHLSGEGGAEKAALNAVVTTGYREYDAG